MNLLTFGLLTVFVFMPACAQFRTVQSCISRGCSRRRFLFIRLRRCRPAARGCRLEGRTEICCTSSVVLAPATTRRRPILPFIFPTRFRPFTTRARLTTTQRTTTTTKPTTLLLTTTILEHKTSKSLLTTTETSDVVFSTGKQRETLKLGHTTIDLKHGTTQTEPLRTTSLVQPFQRTRTHITQTTTRRRRPGIFIGKDSPEFASQSQTREF